MFRELQHVHRGVISLRKNVAMCLNATEALAPSYNINSEGKVQINKSRLEFWAAIFSGKLISEDADSNLTSLAQFSSSACNDVPDGGGWLEHNVYFNKPVSMLSCYC